MRYLRVARLRAFPKFWMIFWGRYLACSALLLCALLIGSATAFAQTEESPSKPFVRIYLNWLPQSQFAGYIMASEKGFFEARGVDVRLIWAAPGESSLRMLDRQEVEFASARLDAALFQRAEGVPVVQVMQLQQRCSLLLMTRKELQKLEQLEGQVVQAWTKDSRNLLEILFKMNNVQVSQILPQSASLAPFISGLVGGAMATEFNEYLRIIDYGLKTDDFNTFAFADYGLGILGDGLYTRREYANQNAQVVRNIREAVREGWYYAFTHRQETAEVIQKSAESSQCFTNIPHQLAMLDAIYSLMTNNGQVPLENIGVLHEKDFVFARDILAREGYAVESLTYDNFVVAP